MKKSIKQFNSLEEYVLSFVKKYKSDLVFTPILPLINYYFENLPSIYPNIVGDHEKIQYATDKNYYTKISSFQQKLEKEEIIKILKQKQIFENFYSDAADIIISFSNKVNKLVKSHNLQEDKQNKLKDKENKKLVEKKLFAETLTPAQRNKIKNLFNIDLTDTLIKNGTVQNKKA